MVDARTNAMIMYQKMNVSRQSSSIAQSHPFFLRSGMYVRTEPTLTSAARPYTVAKPTGVGWQIRQVEKIVGTEGAVYHKQCAAKVAFLRNERRRLMEVK